MFKSCIFCSMGIELPTPEMEVLRKLQRNLAGSSDYARVTCVLMLGMGNSPSFVASCLGIDVSTVYRYCFEKYKEELEVLLTLKFRLCNSQTIPFLAMIQMLALN